MEYKVHARVSNRHVHFTKEDYFKLFDNDLTVRNELNQVGQFAANETVTIKNGDNSFSNVRIVGPFRSYTQVEISKKDARVLGINPPVRRSGDLYGASLVTIETSKGSITLECAIIANRHIHMNYKDAEFYGVKDGQIVKVVIGGDKSGEIDAEIKLSDDGYLELHIDTDDANAFLIEDNDEVTFIV